ncbi:MAG TPA: hypothetical protein VFA24_08275 [Gaiellaceae bacterium]|nr:hypothetical protein [Gaiellaceae bacterium]
MSAPAPAPPDLRRRLVRLVRLGSPGLVARAARRELVWRRHEAGLARAIREGRRLLVGPFLGEVGFELLYWIPVLRRLLAGVERERVTVLARGGAGAWYSDVAEASIDVLELVPAEGYLDEIVARRRREGNTKQFFPDRLDRGLVELALERIGDAAIVHPLVMYSRMRFVLEGLQPPEAAARIGDYRRLEVEHGALPAEAPADYVAVKLYFSDSFPDDGRTRELAAAELERLAAEGDVVVLTSGQQLDEHREWVPAGARIHDSSAWVRPEDNLAVQTALVARARRLVATYGGFSYLGPMLGVPTRALYTQDGFQRVHLDVLRAAYPDAEYELVGP